jgi:DNA-binding response OmpR family regulator
MNSAKVGKPGRILVIDDSKADRDLFKYSLMQDGFLVETACDGREALAMFTKEDYDLALCDYYMPNMDGYQFLTELRKESKWAHVIVIIVTSDESEETKMKLLKAGVNDFIHKGTSHAEIVARIRVHLDVQSAHGNRKILELAGEMADQINQPLSVMVAALDVLREKVQTELPAGQKTEYLEALVAINKQADSMIRVAENLKKLGMDTRKHYRIEK